MKLLTIKKRYPRKHLLILFWTSAILMASEKGFSQTQDTTKKPYYSCPYAKSFEPLTIFISKMARFPTEAIESKVSGGVLIKFDLDSTHRISNITVLQGVGYGCEESMVKLIKHYKKAIDAPAGSYKIGVTYYIGRGDPPKTLIKNYRNDPEFIGEVVMSGYSDDK